MSRAVLPREKPRSGVAAARTALSQVTNRRRRVMASLAIAYAVLSVAVHLGVLQTLDEGVRDVLRPDAEWGSAQVLLNPLIDGLQPVRALAACLVAGVVATVLRRSWRPLLATGTVLGATLLVALVTKHLLARPDPSGGETGIGGSYPSGHVLTLLVAAGVGLLLVSRRPPLALWLLASVPALAMGWALLVCSAHWLTDVLGALLLGATGVVVAGSRPIVRALHALPPHRSEAP